MAVLQWKCVTFGPSSRDSSTTFFSKVNSIFPLALCTFLWLSVSSSFGVVLFLFYQEKSWTMLFLSLTLLTTRILPRLLISIEKDWFQPLLIDSNHVLTSACQCWVWTNDVVWKFDIRSVWYVVVPKTDSSIKWLQGFLAFHFSRPAIHVFWKSKVGWTKLQSNERHILLSNQYLS